MDRPKVPFLALKINARKAETKAPLSPKHLVRPLHFRRSRPYTKRMSKIGTTETLRIAKLARIGLTDQQAENMSAELQRIVAFVEQLQQVDVDNADPTDQVTGLVDVWREDEVRPSMPREQLLANAPEQKDGYIVVKRVLGEGK